VIARTLTLDEKKRIMEKKERKCNEIDMILSWEIEV